MEKEHYLGSANPAGHVLLHVVQFEGEWVALRDWGTGCFEAGRLGSVDRLEQLPACRPAGVGRPEPAFPCAA